MWNERYSGSEYVYGTEPNDFLVEALSTRVIGRVFSAAEGEGRNAVWMASRGADVFSVDSSVAGVAKTLQLAAARGVSVDARVGALEDLELPFEGYDSIVSIFAHLPSVERRVLHRKFVNALRPGGVLVLEAYTPAQLEYSTGGPKDVDLLLTANLLEIELGGLDFIILREVEREVVEGSLHTGLASVVQCLAIKP